MKCFSFFLILLSALPSMAQAEDSGQERRIERLEEQLQEVKNEQLEKKKEVAAATKEFILAKSKVDQARARLVGKYSATQLASLKDAIANAEQERDEKKAALDALKEDVASLQKTQERREDAIDRASAKAEAKTAPEDCPTCNKMSAPGQGKGAPNQGKSTWDNVASIISAATPLGIAGMNTYLGNQAIKTQSSDYRFYNESNTALGLPSAAPSSTAYSNIMNGYSGVSSLLSYGAMGGAGNNGFGNFGAGSFNATSGMNGYSSYSPYAMGGYMGSMGGGTYAPYVNSLYNPSSTYGYTGGFPGYGSTAYNGTGAYGYPSSSAYSSLGYNAYGTSAYGAGAYTGTGSTLDAQVAAQALQESYSRYNSSVQQTAGAFNGRY